MLRRISSQAAVELVKQGRAQYEDGRPPVEQEKPFDIEGAIAGLQASIENLKQSIPEIPQNESVTPILERIEAHYSALLNAIPAYKEPDLSPILSQVRQQVDSLKATGEEWEFNIERLPNGRPKTIRAKKIK